MADHRIRLSDSDLDLVVSALLARRAGVGKQTAERLARLAERLAEGGVGNPSWRFGSATYSAERVQLAPASVPLPA